LPRCRGEQTGGLGAVGPQRGAAAPWLFTIGHASSPSDTPRASSSGWLAHSPCSRFAGALTSPQRQRGVVAHAPLLVRPTATSPSPSRRPRRGPTMRCSARARNALLSRSPALLCPISGVHPRPEEEGSSEPTDDGPSGATRGLGRVPTRSSVRRPRPTSVGAASGVSLRANSDFLADARAGDLATARTLGIFA
jgi:hypothetical protein